MNADYGYWFDYIKVCLKYTPKTIFKFEIKLKYDLPTDKGLRYIHKKITQILQQI